jgi:cellulose synthase/poly-beta-1,6-N-acetylglucosamine synthase-like glycosyltransferase
MVQISFLIPALNEAVNIGNCIAAIRQFGPAAATEIVVGDHGSTDMTVDIATGLGARTVAFRGGTIAALRNFLVQNSTGWLIVFVDADVCITAEWSQAFASTMASLRQQPRQLTGSRCLPPPSENLIIKHWFAEMPTEKHTYLGTGHIIFTRSGFDEIGGFDASLRTGEDYEFCMRARAKGYALNINPSLRVIHHDYPLTIAAFLRRERWHGSGDFQSLAHVLKSKVALLAVVFLGLHATLPVLLFVDWRWAAACGVLILGMVAGMSAIKFPALKRASRIKNMFLFYCYLAGRSWSLLSALRSGAPGTGKALR